ncbi:hypothetical protein AB0395_09075 [Streptosporangium sp. NPDC051023]|uniref:hypothetical protein n=1 Tax=Streptosporangium sp. NPDC051023 TaxID=3155410 RepID=UPI003450A87C
MVKHMVAAAVLASATVSPATAWAETPKPSTTGAPAAVIVYEKSGGFAGIHETITIDRYGKAHGTTTTTSADFQLAPAEFRSLRRRLAYIRTWSSSTAGCDVPDHFTYTLGYRGRHATRCHNLPADWRPAITRFEELVTRYLAPQPSATPRPSASGG